MTSQDDDDIIDELETPMVYHMEVERVLSCDSIHGASQQDLEDSHRVIVETCEEFEKLLREADEYVHSMKKADESTAGIPGAARNFSQNVPENLWNPELVDRYLDTLRKLQALEREFRYAKEGKELFPLPAVPTGTFSTKARNITVARLIWLQQREEGQVTIPLFPVVGHERYRDGQWIHNPVDQEQWMTEDKKWMIGPIDEDHLDLPVPPEWAAIFSLVGRVSQVDNHCLSMFYRAIFNVRESKSQRMKRVDDFTQPATAEAI
ncbi:hypothetical protein BDW02DRAFT_600180 [Decorospora gaudefroyi]|uniref:Uncharacterized protein n=1 Tax=Decorospora gaudefroyi TaxID=184978 RepID=A0A6A5KAP6_9PLEO|nr:hypothetical protein BDW02DRAFT_600180 [Decorospora gaudefroyi]